MKSVTSTMLRLVWMEDNGDAAVKDSRPLVTCLRLHGQS